MNYKLYKNTIPNLSVLSQILYNRGIPLEEQKHWLNAGWEDIYDWMELDKVEEATDRLYSAINNNEKIQVVVDSD